MLLSVLWLPRTGAVYLIGFALFRIFDAGKPWPISKIQQNPRPSCILWDDLAAGLMANLVLQIAIRTFLKTEIL